ncbi:MAG: formate--tetrahydrofolate ligase [Myxococcales bacterium]|nr:formate--tetrahydrofolate ligase [Myxococcota bacterium]MDW8283424.1 formate--tetrahydrofolate ligase [Myxococcales bacterium]
MPSASIASIASIDDVAAELSLRRSDYLPYGEGVAKLVPQAAFVPDDQPLGGRLVLVSAVTPTPAGEGKTTISIGLADSLRRRGVYAVAALRQPSLGPTLGAKGGGAGGGRARLEPFHRVNLGLTGDIHAVTAAHNLLASLVDHALHLGQSPLDPRRIDWPRVMDLDDRSLRHVLTGLGGPLHGVPREGRFDISAASEVMAILCLARDYSDLKRRLGRILVGSTRQGAPVTAAELGAVGGMAVLLREAMLPNLCQTAEGTPALVHGGPFGNIAHGCSSVVATRFALRHAEVVVTEAGFGFDLGGEKFLHIKCRAAHIWPHALVLVATARSLKVHGGAAPAQAAAPNRAALERGADNLRHHVQSARAFGLEPVVAINVFAGDVEEELEAIERIAAELGCPVARCTPFAHGAEGAFALADLVRARLAEAPARPVACYLYELSETPRHKIERVGATLYGATGVELSAQAERDLSRAAAAGLADLPICMAKTHLSLTAHPHLGGRPQPHVLPIQAVRISAGAGFLVPLCGDIVTMPGLGSSPAVLGIDLTDEGEIVGLK